MSPRTMARGRVLGTARGGRNSSERLTALYLDMMAAERGAGKNTLAAYGRDLADFAGFTKGGVASASREDDLHFREFFDVGIEEVGFV